MIAFIPARLESKRLLNKNLLNFFGNPLIAHTVRLAIDSGLFTAVYVTSEAPEIQETVFVYGADVIKRPERYASDDSPDQEWIDHALSLVGEQDFTILRPTNPFRTKEMLERGLLLFKQYPLASQVRAVELCKQHPRKMWNMYTNGTYCIKPLLEKHRDYLKQSNTLPKVYVQNGSLEIRRLKTRKDYIIPLITEGYEGFDINTSEDWILAEELVRRGEVTPYLTEKPESILENSLHS